jgi:hypothetical protein
MSENDLKEAEAEAHADADAEAKADADAKAPGGATREALEKTRASWGFPTFARDFPYDEELGRLVAAFAAGDYATVRVGAPALAAKTDDADVKRAAELLRSRIEPDPTARVFFVLTAALMVFLMVWWATHDGPQHHAPAPAKVPPTVELVK